MLLRIEHLQARKFHVILLELFVVYIVIFVQSIC